MIVLIFVFLRCATSARQEKLKGLWLVGVWPAGSTGSLGLLFVCQPKLFDFINFTLTFLKVSPTKE